MYISIFTPNILIKLYIHLTIHHKQKHTKIIFKLLQGNTSEEEVVCRANKFVAKGKKSPI